ncbi:Os01g0668700, partial [Oryza sativa Japonica Group]
RTSRAECRTAAALAFAPPQPRCLGPLATSGAIRSAALSVSPAASGVLSAQVMSQQ